MDNTTAKVSCFARAYHFENNESPVFADSMAKKILGEDYDQIAENMNSRLMNNLSEDEANLLEKLLTKAISGFNK